MSGAGTAGEGGPGRDVLRHMPRRRAVLSLAPLIDVTFLLLIFFMLVTQFDRLAAIEVSVAKSPPVRVETQTPQAGARSGRMRLAIRADNGLELDGRRIAGTPGLADALERASHVAGRRGDGKPPLLLVEPEDAVPLQFLVDVLASLETQTWFDVRLVYRKPPDGEGRP